MLSAKYGLVCSFKSIQLLRLFLHERLQGTCESIGGNLWLEEPGYFRAMWSPHRFTPVHTDFPRSVPDRSAPSQSAPISSNSIRSAILVHHLHACTDGLHGAQRSALEA